MFLIFIYLFILYDGHSKLGVFRYSTSVTFV